MKRIKAGLIGATFALALSVALALPTEQQVQAEASQGHYAQAEQMMKEVVTAKPGSAKAHYIYAELLAHNGKFGVAADEARQAQQLDSSLSFTDPEKFRSFQQLLASEQGRASGANRDARVSPSGAPAKSSADSGFLAGGSDTGRGGVPGWVWLIAVLGVGGVLWRGFSRSRAAGRAEQAGMMGGAGVGSPGQQVPAYGMGSPGNAGYAPMGSQPGYGAPYGQQPMQQPMARPGSGMLGTGLAVGAGVAGGMLLDEVLHRREGGGGLAPDQSSGRSPMWGPGPTSLPEDDPYAQQLENRPIDFGNGADWDNNGGGGGDIDMGSSGGGDDDWT